MGFQRPIARSARPNRTGVTHPERHTPLAPLYETTPTPANSVYLWRVNPSCDIIIVGGGIIGASIAWHVATTTRRRVCLLERHKLTSGTTWHAAGLVAELRASPSLTRLARYSGQLYEQLQEDGEPLGFRRVGALTLSKNPERTFELQKQAAMARANDVSCEWLPAAAISERWPHLYLEDVEGGVYMPRDGLTNPVDTTLALARLARRAGAEIREDCAVTALITHNGSVEGVVANGEEIRAPQVVLAAGLWTRALGLTAGADIPLYPAEHYYAVTQPLAHAVDRDPIVRVPDDGVYLKPDAGRYLIGCFERQARPLDPDRLPDDFHFGELPFDLEHFLPYLEAGLARLPALADLGIRTWFNGPESFTPDGRYLLGESPQVSNLFVAAGFNSIGIQSAGGVGRVMAQWLDTRQPPADLWEVDIRRMFPFQNQTGYLRARTAESLGRLYAMHWPFFQNESARDQRRSPFHDTLQAAGACHGELAGWERPNWYARDGATPAYVYSHARQNWFDAAAAEHQAVRERAAVFDQSSFAKYQVSGHDAGRMLNRLCTSDIEVPPGRVVYTQWLNERGGIEADVTITRLDEHTWFVVSAAASAVRDLHWLRQHSAGTQTQITDVTHDWAVLGVMGPLSRRVLQQVSDADLGHDAFSFATAQHIPIAGITVRALRITYVGALGWELYIPWQQANHVLTALLEVTLDDLSPAQRALTLAGYHAMDSLRIEKGYRHWGHDITDADTPIEAGLAFTVAWDKPGGFLGREALLAQRECGPTRRLALLQLDDPDALLVHDEPVWCDGQRVGYVTSSAWGHTCGASIAFAWIHGTEGAPLTRQAVLAGDYAVEIADRMVPARVSMRALFDPDNTAIHC